MSPHHQPSWNGAHRGRLVTGRREGLLRPEDGGSGPREPAPNSPCRQISVWILRSGRGARSGEGKPRVAADQHVNKPTPRRGKGRRRGGGWEENIAATLQRRSAAAWPLPTAARIRDPARRRYRRLQHVWSPEPQGRRLRAPRPPPPALQRPT